MQSDVVAFTGKSLSEVLLFAEHGENMLCTKIVLNVRNNFSTQHVLPRFNLGIFMYWTCNSMNNLSSYCGLVDVKIGASDLPVKNNLGTIEMNKELREGWQDLYILVDKSIGVEKKIPKLTLWFPFFTGKNCFLHIFSPIDGWWYPNLNVGRRSYWK